MKALASRASVVSTTDGFCVLNFDELLTAARVELDNDKRRAMYYEMQEFLSNDGGLTALMFASHVFGTRDNVVTPAQLGSSWDMDG